MAKARVARYVSRNLSTHIPSRIVPCPSFPPARLVVCLPVCRLGRPVRRGAQAGGDIPLSLNHSPLEGESANQGRSLRIFRWGESRLLAGHRAGIRSWPPALSTTPPCLLACLAGERSARIRLSGLRDVPNPGRHRDIDSRPGNLACDQGETDIGYCRTRHPEPELEGSASRLPNRLPPSFRLLTALRAMSNVGLSESKGNVKSNRGGQGRRHRRLGATYASIYRFPVCKNFVTDR